MVTTPPVISSPTLVTGEGQVSLKFIRICLIIQRLPMKYCALAFLVWNEYIRVAYSLILLIRIILGIKN